MSAPTEAIQVWEEAIALLPPEAQQEVDRLAQQLRDVLKSGEQNERILKFAALQRVAMETLEPDYVI